MAYASGQFANPGDAQSSLFVVRGSATGANPINLWLDGDAITRRILVPNNATWAFEILIVGRTSTGTSAIYHIRGGIKNVSGTTSIVGTLPAATTVAADAGAASWGGVTVVADDANDALQVRVTGAAATTIRWVANVRTSEVTY